MSRQRELLERALSEIKEIGYNEPYLLIKDIEAELAKPEHKPEWLAVDVDDKTHFFNPDMIEYAKDFNEPITKLYAEPKYNPLSDNEIMAMSRMLKINYFPPDGAILNFARLIEKQIIEGK